MDGDGVEAVDVAALLLPHTTLRRDVFTQEYDIQYELYARRLPSLSLEELQEEPVHLQRANKRLQEEIDDLALRHRLDFMAAFSSCKRMEDELYLIDAEASKLLQGLPSFVDCCTEFRRQADAIEKEKKLEKMLLDRSTELAELLEIPQLMDTCVRNQMYDEALSMRTFVHSLTLKFGDLRLLQDIIRSTEVCTEFMLSQILADLCGGLSIPATMKVIRQLGQLSLFSERDLRLLFLQCRNVRFYSCTKEVTLSNPLDELCAFADVFKAQMMETVNLYKSVFSDRPDPTNETACGVSHVLYGWVADKVALFEKEYARLVAQLSDCEECSRVVEHCADCSTSLSRIGVDITGFLFPVVETQALRLCNATFMAACKAFQAELTTWSFPDTAPLSGDPAQDVAAHQPLAVFANGVVSVANELRNFCIPSLAPHLCLSLQAALCWVFECYLQALGCGHSGSSHDVYSAQLPPMQPLPRKQQRQPGIRSFSQTLVSSLVPLCLRTLHSAFSVCTSATPFLHNLFHHLEDTLLTQKLPPLWEPLFPAGTAPAVMPTLFAPSLATDTEDEETPPLLDPHPQE